MAWRQMASRWDAEKGSLCAAQLRSLEVEVLEPLVAGMQRSEMWFQGPEIIRPVDLL